MRKVENGKLGVRPRLIIQSSDTTMVHEGEIPFLYVPDTDSMNEWAPVLIQAVNFLKAGQTQVRIWSNFVDRMPSDERLTPFFSNLNRMLHSMEQNARFCVYRLWDGVVIVDRVPDSR